VKISRVAIALYMALVLASGAALGVFGQRYYDSVTKETNQRGGKSGKRRPTPEEFQHGAISYMQKRLSLTEEQVTKLGVIMDGARAAMDDVMRRTMPEQAAIGAEQTEKIRAVLTDQQRAEYEKMLKEREERMKNNKGKKDGRRGGPGLP
jgi:Spy/CpxP family protein refolding chaperone